MTTVDNILMQSAGYLDMHDTATEGAVNMEYVDMVTDINAPLHLQEKASTDDEVCTSATGGKGLSDIPGDSDLYDRPKSNAYLNNQQPEVEITNQPESSAIDQPDTYLLPLALTDN